MAKKDADLFDRLRQVGLRKQAAKALSGVSDTAGKQAQRAARAAVSELRAVADEIERRLPAAAPASGSSGESSAATSRARARTRPSTKASAARTKRPVPRNPGPHPAARPLGQVADPAHGQRRRLRRVPSARHRRRIRHSRRPRPVPSPTHRGRIRHRRRRGDLKPHTSGALRPTDKPDETGRTKNRNRGEVLAVELVTGCSMPRAAGAPFAEQRGRVLRVARSRPPACVSADVGAGESHPAPHHHARPCSRSAGPTQRRHDCRVAVSSLVRSGCLAPREGDDRSVVVKQWLRPPPTQASGLLEPRELSSTPSRLLTVARRTAAAGLPGRGR